MGVALMTALSSHAISKLPNFQSCWSNCKLYMCVCVLLWAAGDKGRDSDDSFDFSGDEQQAEERRYRVRGVRTLGLQPRELSLPEIREVRLIDRGGIAAIQYQYVVAGGCIVARLRILSLFNNNKLLHAHSMLHHSFLA